MRIDTGLIALLILGACIPVTMEEDDPNKFDALGRCRRSPMFYKSDLIVSNDTEGIIQSSEGDSSLTSADHPAPLNRDSTNLPSQSESNENNPETQRAANAFPHSNKDFTPEQNVSLLLGDSRQTSSEHLTQTSACLEGNIPNQPNNISSNNVSNQEAQVDSRTEVPCQKNYGFAAAEQNLPSCVSSSMETDALQMPSSSRFLPPGSPLEGESSATLPAGKRHMEEIEHGERPSKLRRSEDACGRDGRDLTSPSTPVLNPSTPDSNPSTPDSNPSTPDSNPSTPDSSSSSTSDSSSPSTSNSSSSSTSDSGDSDSTHGELKYTALKEKYSLDDKVIEVNGQLRSKMDYLLTAQCMAARHNLTDVAIEDLLKSYNCQLGQEVIPTSIYLFNKIFSVDSGLEFHLYCNQCESYLGEKSDLQSKGNNMITCPVQLCKYVCDISTMNDNHFFVVLPLRHQLKCFLECQSNIDELLSYRFTRDHSDDTVRDIFDGLQYKNLSKPGEILHEPQNLSVTLFTDGAKVFMSGNNSLWPIMCRLNELPPNCRFNVLLGTTKHLLSLWLDSKYAHKDFSVRHRMEEIDSRLRSLKPPSKLYKRFERISNFSQYKANMLEPWLLFYSIPCLVEILPDQYLRHFALLVTSIYTLLTDCITQAELDHCEELLLTFVKDFETLYGPSRMVYNVHLLTHLVTCVRNWGPLWAYSAFCFESGNGMLKKLVKGTVGVVTQIARKYALIRFLPKILKQFDVSDSVKEFCSDIFVIAKRCQVASKHSGVTLLGDVKVEPLSREECRLLQSADLPEERNCYGRMIVNGIKYHSKFYSRECKKTYDCGVYLKNGNFGKIRRIFVVNNIVYVVIRSVDIEENAPIVSHPSINARASHLKVCKMYPFGDLKLIKATDVSNKF